MDTRLWGRFNPASVETPPELDADGCRGMLDMSMRPMSAAHRRLAVPLSAEVVLR